MSNGTTTTVVGNIVLELIATPNGQIRLLGGVLCVGPGYYILPDPGNTSMFAYALLGVGFILIMLSAIMATIAAKYREREDRAVVRDVFDPSDRLKLFTREILNVPRTRAEIAELHFSGYETMVKPQLISLLLQTTANECVLAGLASRQNGIYVDRDATDSATVFRDG